MLCYLKHQNILEFLGIHEHEDGRVDIVFPYIDGGSIKDYMNKHASGTFNFDIKKQWASTQTRIYYSVCIANDTQLAS